MVHDIRILHHIWSRVPLARQKTLESDVWSKSQPSSPVANRNMHMLFWGVLWGIRDCQLPTATCTGFIGGFICEVVQKNAALFKGSSCRTAVREVRWVLHDTVALPHGDVPSSVKKGKTPTHDGWEDAPL